VLPAADWPATRGRPLVLSTDTNRCSTDAQPCNGCMTKLATITKQGRAVLAALLMEEDE
jgi:hypothetical protein